MPLLAASPRRLALAVLLVVLGRASGAAVVDGTCARVWMGCLGRFGLNEAGVWSGMGGGAYMMGALCGVRAGRALCLIELVD